MIEFLTTLLDYQQRAVKKLHTYRVGALYMEQGTGKTRTALEIIAQKLNAGKVDHVLWLCPCNIKNEIKGQLYEHIGYIPANFTVRGIESVSMSDRLYLKLNALVECKSCYIVVDESNLIKNFSALRTQRIIALGKKCRYRMILNGTPISRNEADLFAQWYFLDWRILGYKSYWSFEHHHVVYDTRCPGRIKSIENVEYLVRQIEPFVFQIKKDECLNLPKKRYNTKYTTLTNEQYDHYEDVRDGFLEYLDERRPETIYRLFSALQSVTSGFRIVTPPNKPIRKIPFFHESEDNPRLREFLKFIAHETDEKIIIFCHYQQEIENATTALNRIYGQGAAIAFYGETPLRKRYERIQAFKTVARFFVANKRCAAYGLNLQFCHRVIYYSNDWDLATRLQSEDRVHRIGQTHDVLLTDFCALSTIDERIINCLGRKRSMADELKREIAKQSKNGFTNIKDIAAAWLRGGHKIE